MPHSIYPTPLQSAVYIFCKEHWAKQQGKFKRLPTTRRIAHKFGWDSENSSRKHLKALLRKGLLKRNKDGRLVIPD